jgi:signal transduction histidine kinase
MKIFVQGVWARRKIIVVFLLGILIPSLCVCYLSWTAFSKRREALSSAIESQLWMAGEAAVESIERALQEHEDGILSPENFMPLSTLRDRRQEFDESSLLSKEKIFVLDADFQIVFPQAGSEDISYVQWEQSPSDSPFTSLFRRAEYLEFKQEKFAEAAEFYQRCILSTPINQLKAYALERYGRCLILTKRYHEAIRVYKKLLVEYGQYKNRVGLPYGLIAGLLWHEIAQQQQQMQGDVFEALIDVLDKLKDGKWSLNRSTYDFYLQEIDLLLKNGLSEEKYPELYKSYNRILEKPSLYFKELEFEKLLAENVVPVLKETVLLSRYSNESIKGRLPVTCDDSSFLISYARLRDIQSDQYFYAGFCWDLESLKNQKIPEIANNLAQTSGIQVRIIDQSHPHDLSAEKSEDSQHALSVTFRQFPFPWRFVVTLSALESLRSTSLRQNILYGIIAVLIVGLISLGVVLIARDISRESETIRHRTDFVQNISHELKTPLTLIRLYGDTLRDKKTLPEEDRQEAYEVIIGESERLSHMINNVLDFSRIERGEKEFNLKIDHLPRVVKETLESYRDHLEKKGFSIHEEIHADLQPMAFDREAMVSVLINLLSNAMKFSPERKDVSVRLFRREDNAVLQVADKGMGIPKKEINKIFQRFYRSKNKAFSGSGGSGLGLTIVKYITAAHKGKIEVESQPGKGSIFSVILPIH